VALGDVDGDGDLDAVIGNVGQNRVYSNLRRQIAWRGFPRIGKPLVIDVYGAPGGAWLLAASLATASIPLPPLGTLRLDPASSILFAAGSLDPQGRGSIGSLVPADPNLIGRSLHWQALVASPLALTNLETTTFTDL
jgi:hypothetical protein